MSECDDRPDDGFVCPLSLPDVEEFRLACDEGCYLFSPVNAIEAEVNRLKVATYKDQTPLVDELRLKVGELSTFAAQAVRQRDSVRARLETAGDVMRRQAGLMVAMQAEIAERPDPWLKVWVGLGCFGAGLLGGIVLVLAL